MKHPRATALAAVILAASALVVSCSKDSSSPTSPATSPYPDSWLPLAEGISTVWENIDYDTMGMAGMMYVDTSACEMVMRGGGMYYRFGVDIGEREGAPEDSLCLQMRGDSLFVRDFSATSEPREVLEAIFPPVAGTVWSGDWEGYPSKWASVGQSCTVPAGTFSNVAVLQIGPMGADSSYKQFWFAKGEGVVKVQMWMDHPTGGMAHDVMPMHKMEARKIIFP